MGSFNGLSAQPGGLRHKFDCSYGGRCTSGHMVRKRRCARGLGPYGSARRTLRRHPTVSYANPTLFPNALKNRPFRYFYSGSTFAITESDGVRVIGPDTCEFIQKVPGEPPCHRLQYESDLIATAASSVAVFRPGSTAPAAILYDAWVLFSKRSPKADESIRSIRPELAAAVDGCIDAAGREWEPQWQRRLLNVSHSILLATWSDTLSPGSKIWQIILGSI